MSLKRNKKSLVCRNQTNNMSLLVFWTVQSLCQSVAVPSDTEISVAQSQWRSQRGGTGGPGPPRNAHQKIARFSLTCLVDWTLSPERWFSPIHRRIRPSGLPLQAAADGHSRSDSFTTSVSRVTTAVCTAVTGHQPGDWPASAWCRVNCVGAATAQAYVMPKTHGPESGARKFCSIKLLERKDEVSTKTFVSPRNLLILKAGTPPRRMAKITLKQAVASYETLAKNISRSLVFTNPAKYMYSMITNIKQLVDTDQREFVCSSTMKFSRIKYGCKIRPKWSSEFCSMKLLERKDVRSTGGGKEQELHVSVFHDCER